MTNCPFPTLPVSPDFPLCSRPLVPPELAAMLNPPWTRAAANLALRLPAVFGKTYTLPAPHAGIDFIPPARKPR